MKSFSFFKVRPIETNIVCVGVNHPVLNAFDFERLLKEKGIRVFALDKNTIRIIVHLDIKENDIQEVVASIKTIQKSQ